MAKTTDAELIAKAKYTFVDLMVGDVKRTFGNDILLGSLILFWTTCGIPSSSRFKVDHSFRSFLHSSQEV